jgi:hypothetical protein
MGSWKKAACQYGRDTDRGTDIGSCDCTGNDDVSECISGVRQDAAAGEEQMESYYDSRNQLENNRTAKQASGRYVLELEASGTGGMKKSLASNAYQTGTQTNYRTGQYPIVLYVSQADSDAEEEEVNLQELLYRYR